MNRFAGKFSFYYRDYKLIFFDSRVGFVHKTNTTFIINKKPVALPAEASIFFAYERMDGWAVLHAFNGEPLGFGGEISEDILPTTVPTRNPRYPGQVYLAHFDLSLLRAARTSEGRLTKIGFKRPDASFKGVAYLRPRYTSPGDLDTSDGSLGLTNLSSSAQKEPTKFEVVWHADGVTEMTAGTKTVSRFDFRAAGKGRVDLSGEDLSGVKFGYADFAGAVLTGTKFTGANFERAGFTNANLDAADFTNAKLEKVNFQRASMHRTILTGVTGKSCDFSYCDLRNVTSAAALALESPEGDPLRFSHAKLRYPLIGPKWTYRHLDYAVIEALPTMVSDLDAQHAVLTGLELGSLTATSAKFNNATMHGVGLTGAKLISATFDAARLEGVSLGNGDAIAAADFTGADLRNASFNSANASGVSFSGAKMTEAKFSGATLRGANFANAFLKNVDFSAVEQKMMHSSNFSRAFLVNSKFSGADLSVNVFLVQAYLHGADFSNAQFGNANLAGAGIATESGSLRVTMDGSTSDVDYEATDIDPATATSSITRCPNGDLGPCSTEKMVPTHPFPTSWPWPAGVPGPFDETE